MLSTTIIQKKKRRYINNPVPLAISGSGFVDVSFLPFISSDVMLKVKGLDSRSMTPLDLCLYITFCNLLMLQYFNTGILFQGSAASFFGFRGLYHVVPDKRTLPRNTPRNSGLQFPGYIWAAKTGCLIEMLIMVYLVHGWTNPSEKYARQIGNLPQVRGKN